jgi:hypothetical protein
VNGAGGDYVLKKEAKVNTVLVLAWRTEFDKSSHPARTMTLHRATMNTSGRFEIQNLGQMILALQVCGFPDTLLEPVEREYSLCVDAGMSEALLQFRIDHLHRLIARASAFDEANWDFALRVFHDRDRDPEAAS